MRIALYGGSFDPVHYGHLILAETCREACQLDEIRVVPASIAPHKRQHARSGDQHRWDMLQLALGGHPSIRPWDIELRRGGISYTVDTLQALREACPQDTLFLLLGADSLHDLPNWREPGIICELACPIVVARPGDEVIRFELLEPIMSASRLAELRQHVVSMPLIGLSSSDLRDRVRQGKSIRYRTPRAVEKFIEAHRLYQMDATTTFTPNAIQ